MIKRADSAVSGPSDGGGWVTADVPAGWEVTRKRVSNLIDPKQLLTAGSFDLNPAGGPKVARGGCTPAGLLELMPADGALITVTGYSRSHLSNRALTALPPRPRHLRLGPRYRGKHECGGLFDIQFRQGGRGYKIDIWLNPERVDPATRREADRVLASLELQKTL